MSQKEKLLSKLFTKPKDFKWDELRNLLVGLGYRELEGSGSRVKFQNDELGSMINLHKPHPGNIVKSYVIERVIEVLKEKGIRP
ncbi:MAG: type II toxin-antitoxin system HicA family toxin [Bacteroidales bacterium]|nr:type II toxin-antitoxin system HicA family toxin [Bacteroidales bacterium]